MKRFRNGLVVGKFSPLHKGHEFIIRRAMEECEQVFIFSYSNPEFENCEADRRELWLKTLFPETEIFVFTSEFLEKRFNFALPANDADDLTQRRLVGFLWLHFVNEPLDAVFTSEDYGEGFAAELTRYFALYADFPEVRHISVDLRRETFPVSGTQLRENVHDLKHFLSPEVYASFIRRVCFLGGESSGKSSLAKTIAREFETAFVAEYGRTLWEEQSGNLAFEDLLKIAKTHIKHEESAARGSNRFLFVDTTPLTTLFYSLHLFGKADPELKWLANRKYDYTFLCASDFPFVQDGTRAGEELRNRQHEWYLQQLKQRNVEYILLQGNFAERIERIKSVLSETK
ncbi:MAG TPA: AAA family ATPase [Pyrinomonadaceae bacterium]|jgi:NadR type nicotinamide-nucleotide adenylyltransferase